ncbi:MAG: dihydroorotate dehydrogenase (quinone) [Bacteroidetes bacterium]|nr:MAG: dihydroorotate dehydrogenase (quinone) [Bacteroidota bacterium]
MYQLLRRFFFLFSPEWIHYFAMNCFRLLCSIPLLGNLISYIFSPKQSTVLSTELFGIKFRNPVGLAAGFDKNAKYLHELKSLGFGFVEIGTVTPKPQAGNDKPRLFRLPADNALLNRMGFNNDGVEMVAARLKKWKEKNDSKSGFVVGGNIGKNKSTPNEDAWKDYEICFRSLFEFVDYFVVNVSSPNTPGLRELQEKDSLRKILTNLQRINREQTQSKPILLKIAPDLSEEALSEIVGLALEINLDGIVAANTTLDRNILSDSSRKLCESYGAGGLSGLPLASKSTHIIDFISRKTLNKIPIIGSGGIFDTEKALEKINAGASLIQVWTGFIYIGPSITKKICNGIIRFRNKESKN